MPSSPYGAAKLAIEAYVAAFCDAYGVRGSSVRLSSLFGPGLRRHVVHDLMLRLTEDRSALTVRGDGGQVRDLMYISDCVQALVVTATRGSHDGAVYNVAGGNVISIRELVDAICQVIGVSPTVTLTGQNRHGAPDRWLVGGSRLRSLGYRPRVTL